MKVLVVRRLGYGSRLMNNNKSLSLSLSDTSPATVESERM